MSCGRGGNNCCRSMASRSYRGWSWSHHSSWRWCWAHGGCG